MEEETKRMEIKRTEELGGRHGGRRRSMRNDENVKGGWFDRQCARQG